MKTFADTKYGNMTGKIYKGENDISIAGQNVMSLMGSPNTLAKWRETSFNAKDNLLVDLRGAPQSLGGYFHCADNPRLISLEGGPKDSGSLFNCKNCPKLENPIKQIIFYQIKATEYNTDEGNFEFKDIEEEFNKHTLDKKVQSKGFRTLLGLDK